MGLAQPIKFGFILCRDPEDVDVLQPLSFGYLKSYVQKYSDIDIEMIFLLDTSEIDESFDIIGISCVSQDFGNAKELAKWIRTISTKIVIILGGFHITNFPHTLPPEVDVGFLGEAEQSFLEFITCFHHSKTINKAELKKIDGIVFHADKLTSQGSVYMTGPRGFIEPLDRIPFPDRTSNKTSNIYLFTSRGCPFRCTFCSSSRFWKGVRYFSPGYVIEEIKSIEKQYPNLWNLIFYDDLFIANRHRFVEIADAIVRENLHERFSFNLSVRADLVDAELCAIFKKINVSSVSFGAESGSQRMYSFLKGRHGSVETNQKALDILHSHNISVSNTFIIGSPSETEDDVHRTYHFAIRNIMEGKLARASVNILSPMPGTAVWETAKAQGALSDDMDWRRLRGFAAYMDSNSGSIERFFHRRLENRTIYLAEETLPQARLFELMRFYEHIVTVLTGSRQQPTLGASTGYSELKSRYVDALFRQRKQITFIDDLSLNAGYFDGFRLIRERGCYEAYGWARHPAKGTPGVDILLFDQNHNWLGHALVDQPRADVAGSFKSEKMLVSGWRTELPVKKVPSNSITVRAYLYDVTDNRAYALSGKVEIEGCTDSI